jgi:hypothetical protein
MDMRISHHRHDGLAGEADAGRLGRDRDAGAGLLIFAPLTTIVLFSMTRPSPTMMRAPSNAVTCACALSDQQSGKGTDNRCRDSDCTHSAHGFLHRFCIDRAL